MDDREICRFSHNKPISIRNRTQEFIVDLVNIFVLIIFILQNHKTTIAVTIQLIIKQNLIDIDI